jgi:predicted transcriptional regulator
MEVEKFPSIVSDIMSSPVISVDGGVNIRDAAILMTEKSIGSLVIVERGTIKGIVTKTDIIKRLVVPCLDPCIVTVNEILSTPVITINKDAGILEAMRKMREHSITQLVVMDGDVLEGVVSERDVTRGVSIASIGSFSSLLRRRE